MTAHGQPLRGQARERNGLLVRAASAGIVLRVASVLATIVMYAVAARSLDGTELGIWLTITSMATIATIGDFGLGASVTSELAGSGGPHSPLERRRAVVTAAYPTVAAAGLVMTAVVGVAVIWTPVVRSLGASEEARDTFLFVLAVVGLTIPLTIGARVLEGLQLGWQSNLAQTVGISVGMAIFMILAVRSPSLGTLAPAAVSGRLIGALACCAVSIRRPGLVPRPSAFRIDELARLARSGGWFFLIAAAATISFGADSLILAAARGPGAVAEYSAAYRLFTFAPIMTFVLLQATWPAIAEALHHGDQRWVARIYRRILAASFGGNLLATIPILVLADAVMEIWLDDGVSLGMATTLLAAGGGVAQGVLTPVALLSNGLGDVRYQACVMAGAAIVNAAVSIPLAITVGAPGPLFGSMLGLVASTVVLARRNRSLMRRSVNPGVVARSDRDRR